MDYSTLPYLTGRGAMYCDRRVRMSVCLSVRERIGVNAAGVAGVATPQYLTCRGRPVLTTPNILTSVLFFTLQRNF